MFCATLLLIRLHHQRAREALADADNPHTPLTLAEAQRVFPEAVAIALPHADGTQAVTDADGTALGYVLQTSPDANDIIGFSGGTNTLLGFDNDERITGLHILESRDTEEHIEKIVADPKFAEQFVGLAWNEAAALQQVDAVSGATLSSYAISDGIAVRLRGEKPADKPLPSKLFPDPPTVAEIQHLLPTAVSLEPDDRIGGWFHVRNSAGESVGNILRTTPSAERVNGYQGPTETLIVLDSAGKVLGLVVGRSYDNEPYTDYVREEVYFLELFNDRDLVALASLDADAEQIEGVSGATMTSTAVVDSLRVAAADFREQQKQLAAVTEEATPPEEMPSLFVFTASDYGTAGMVCLGLLISLTRLRQFRGLRWVFLSGLVVYLGLINGDLLSQANLVGWAQQGVPTRHAGGLVLLTATALLLPMVSKSNVYCTHLCPHGAAQQLLHRLRGSRKSSRKVSRRWRVVLLSIPAVLVMLTVVVAMIGEPAMLVHIEPFHAYLWQIAGGMTIAIAIGGLIAAWFVPMAYCRYGCPTGVVLGFLRYNRGSGELTPRDVVAILCLILAAGNYFFNV